MDRPSLSEAAVDRPLVQLGVVGGGLVPREASLHGPLAHGLDLVTVAEGVETPEQDALLKELRCNMVQGNYYSRPRSIDDIKHIVSRGTPKLKAVRTRY